MTSSITNREKNMTSEFTEKGESQLENPTTNILCFWPVFCYTLTDFNGEKQAIIDSQHAMSHRIDHGPVQFVRKEFVLCGRYPLDQILDALSFLLGARWLHLRGQNGRFLVLGIFQRNQSPLFGRRDLFVFVVEDVADRQTLAPRSVHGALGRTW